MRPAALAALVLLAGCGGAPEIDPAAPSPASVALLSTMSEGTWWAVSSDLESPLTAERCVQLALRRAPDAAALEARLETARAQLVTAETWPAPTLSALVQDVGDSERALAQVQVSHRVLFYWTGELMQRLATAGLDAAGRDVDEERRLIGAAAGEAFLEAVAADELAAAEQAGLASARRLRDVVEQRAAHGDASELERERARAEELDALRAADAAEERREVTRLLLAELVGASSPAKLRLAPIGEVPGIEQGAPQLLDLALERRADVRRARARVSEADAAVLLEERRAWPLADLQLTLGVRSGEEGTTGLIGVALPLPVFDRNQGARRRAAAGSLGAVAELQRVARRVLREVATAAVTTRRARVRLVDVVLPLERARGRTLELARGLFDGGEMGQGELLLVERDAVAARRAVALARRDLTLAAWRLRAASGDLNTDEGGGR